MSLRLLTTLMLVSLLTACSASTRLDGEKVVAEAAKQDARLIDETPPAEDLRSCLDPVILPLRKLSAGETERYMRKDRIALVDCGARKQNVQDFYADRDARIAGKRPGD